MPELADALGSEPPREFARLPAAQQRRLAAMLVDARERRAADLAEAIRKSLRYLPPLLRGTVRRALGL